MKYLSTRGDATPRHFCEILLEGLAPDGGLYLPEHYPQVDTATLDAWRGLPYHELAFRILEQSHVAVGPGRDFGAIAEGHLRFSYATSEAQITRGLERLARVLPTLRA